MSAERACPVCKSNEHVPFAKERIDAKLLGTYTYASRKIPEFMCLRLVRCTQCDLVYAPSPPSEELLHSAYSSAEFDSNPEAEAAALTYAEVLAPLIRGLERNQAAIDVGAGSGPLLRWLKGQGFAPVVGVEPSRAAIDAAASDVRPMLMEGMFSADFLKGYKPSLVCSFMTLEHVRDPAKFIDDVYALLNHGGALAVVVHNWRAPLNRLLGLRSPIIDVEHLQLFSPQSLRHMLKRAGFVSIELQQIRNRYSLRYWVRLSPLPSVFKRFILKVLLILGIADRGLSLSVGNILAFAIKPR